VCAPFGIGGVLRLDASTVSPGLWVLLVWYAMTASVLCTVLWYRGVAHVERWAAGLATAAVPVTALAVAAVVLGERISAAQMTGGALVVGAIAAGTLCGRRR
jgi:drug/metabolite transporter (DMT)-like permease